MTDELQLEEAACPGCGSEQAETVYEAEDFIYGMDPRRFPLRRCKGCALVYLGRRPTCEAIARAYPDTYLWRQARTSAPPGASLNEQLVAFYFRQLYARRARFASSLLPGAHPRVLDLGCGEGHFLAALAAQRAGDWLGLDFVVGDAPPGVTLLPGDLNALALENAPFDMVTFWHVLEHLHAPRRALAEAYRLLAPGGLLVVATQNFDALSRRLMGPGWPLNDIPRHLCHFTPATLKRLVREAGFEPLAVKGFTEYFPVLGGHLFPRLTARPDGTLRALPGLAASALFAPLEVGAILAGAGCTFNLVARRPQG